MIETRSTVADSVPPVRLSLTDTEARFVGAALAAYIGRLESGADADRLERQRLGIPAGEEAATVSLVLGQYRSLLRRLELAAGYPFLVESDAWDAVAGRP